MIPVGHLVLRIAVGSVLGGIIGLERDRHGRPVGFRTHMIVGMAAATFMVVSAHFVYYQNYADGDHVGVDTSRIAASVVTGIGFLAGGAIFKAGAAIQGLTTASALWLVTAIGLCAGSGMYALAFAVTGMGLLALALLRFFEGEHAKGYKREISLELRGGPETVERIREAIVAMGVALSEFDYGKSTSDNKVSVTFEARVRSGTSVQELIKKIEGDPDVMHVRVGRPK